MVKMGSVMQLQTLPTTAGPEIVNARYLAKRYQVTPECIGRWAKMGKIPVIRFQGTVRFNLAAVIEAIEGGAR
jgi:hypothetical protein